MPHSVRRVSEREFIEDLPSILDAMDQPSIDGVNTWFISKAAREAGLKVAISGLGGDELLAGYESFSDLPRWRRRFGPFAAIPGVGRLARALIGFVAPRFAIEHPKVRALLEYSNTWAGTYLLRRGLFLPHELSGVMNPELAREGMRRLKPLELLARRITPDPGSNIRRVCALESSQYMRNQLLRDADWAGMAHGVEIRVPLVDMTLLRSIAPVIDGLGAGAGKAALAKAPSRPLPDDIVMRAKTGFGVPTGAWMASASARQAAGVEPKGLVSRRWSRVVLAGSDYAFREAYAA
jgi:asparagine synthase (glutamine-hydrolysing)